jgi:hypothetical protein
MRFFRKKKSLFPRVDQSARKKNKTPFWRFWPFGVLPQKTKRIVGLLTSDLLILL